MNMNLGCLLLSLIGLVNLALGSPGDWLDEFIDCRESCEVMRSCSDPSTDAPDHHNGFDISYFDETPVFLRKCLLWDCESDCDYQCQQIVTILRIENGEEIYQFHGKWPFKRLFGIQELYSTLFSIANFVPHYRGFKILRSELKKLSHYDKSGILLDKYVYVSIAGMLAWTASSIFHLRDLIVTEKLDYFFAGATVLSGFHAIFIRIFRLDKHDNLRHLFCGTVILIFLMHILRLYLDWSYTYNMRFNVAFGVLQYLLLLTLSYRNYVHLKSQPKSRSSPYASQAQMTWQLCTVPLLLVVGTSLAMSCELFDFFSYTWQIDSHAIWHACTILPSWKLYDFFIRDYRYLKHRCNSLAE